MSENHNTLTVYKGRTNILPVSFGYDISGSTFESQIRAKPDPSSTLIATWAVTFDSDGTDGELVLTLDDAITSAVTVSKGYMDIKRIVGGEPIAAHNGVIEVFFKDTVTS